MQEGSIWWLSWSIEDVKGLVELVKFELPTTSRAKNEFILLLGRANGLARDKHEGLVTSEDLQVRKNRIAAALTDIIDQYELPSVQSYIERYQSAQ